MHQNYLPVSFLKHISGPQILGDDQQLRTISEELLKVVRVKLESYRILEIFFKTSLSYEYVIF